MKLKLLFVLITLQMPFFCLGQIEISNIDKYVQEVKNKLPSIEKIERINDTRGSNFAYFEGKNLKLIAVKSLDPTTEKNVEWYFVDGQLTYCETNWVDTQTRKNIFKEKLYLHCGNLISWTNSNSNTFCASSSEFKKMNIDLIEYSKKMIENASK